MKFIGIPKTVRKKNEAFRSVIGALLLFSLIVVCVVGAESVLTSSRMTTSTPDNTLVSAAPTVVSSEMAPLNIDATVPDLISRSNDTVDLSDEAAGTPTADPAAVTTTPAASPTPASVTDTDPTVATAPAVVTAAATPTPAVTETAETGHYYVTAVLSIRSGPGTEFEKSGSYKAGDEVDVIASTSNGWKKIADAQYVIDDFLSATPPETELVGTYYAIGEINVRTGPGTDYSTTKTLVAGDAISVVAQTSTGWYRTAKGTYVKADLCTSTPPSTPTPKSTSAPTPTPKPTPAPTPTPAPPPEPGSLTLVGSFRVTYYGPQLRSDGTYSTTTSSNTTCTEGRTIAVDPEVIKIGSKVYIEGVSIAGNGGYFIAEDEGTAVNGNIVDIFANDGESGAYNTLNNINVYIVN